MFLSTQTIQKNFQGLRNKKSGILKMGYKVASASKPLLVSESMKYAYRRLSLALELFANIPHIVSDIVWTPDT